MKDCSDLIIVSDMDGTLLNSRKEISKENLDAIDKFRKLGGHFTVATGRTIQSFQRYVDILKLDMPVILYNGAMIYDYNNDKILYSIYLPEEAKNISIEILESMEDIGGEILKKDGTYIFKNNEYEQLHTDLCKITPEFCSLYEMSPERWLKVLFATSPENLEKLVDFIDKKGYNKVSFVKSSGIFYEMLEPSSNKGVALDIYRKLDGMQNFKFISVGDYDNDAEMIKMADFGAVPSNAQPEVKKTADILLKSSCDENAVAELIDRLINY